MTVCAFVGHNIGIKTTVDTQHNDTLILHSAFYGDHLKPSSKQKPSISCRTGFRGPFCTLVSVYTSTTEWIAYIPCIIYFTNFRSFPSIKWNNDYSAGTSELELLKHANDCFLTRFVNAPSCEKASCLWYSQIMRTGYKN